MVVVKEAKITKLDLMRDYANNLVSYIWEKLDRDFDLYLGNYEVKMYAPSSVGDSNYNIVIYNMDNLPEELSPDDKSLFEKAFNYYVNEYISSNKSPIENKKVKSKYLDVEIPKNGKLPEFNWLSRIIGSNHKMVIYVGFGLSNDMPQWPSGISIDDVAKEIGKFVSGSKMANGPYFQTPVYGSHFPQELGKVSIPIKYWRETLSYGNSFKYRDRFKMIGKLKIGKSKVEDLLSETDIKLVAECNLNTDIILMWTHRGVYLLNRKDFEEGLVKIMDILNNKTDESLSSNLTIEEDKEAFENEFGDK